VASASGIAVLVLFGIAAVAAADSSCGAGNGTDADADFDLDLGDDDGLAACDGVVVVRTASGTAAVPGNTSFFDSDESPNCDLRAGGGGDDEAIEVLQNALVRCNGQSIAVDGEYGSGTVRAVTNVQRQHGIAADGAYGPATLQVMDWPGSGGSGCVTGVTSAAEVVDEEF
jgi:hypothetical protein